MVCSREDTPACRVSVHFSTAVLPAGQNALVIQADVSNLAVIDLHQTQTAATSSTLLMLDWTFRVVV